MISIKVSVSKFIERRRSRSGRSEQPDVSEFSAYIWDACDKTDFCFNTSNNSNNNLIYICLNSAPPPAVCPVSLLLNCRWLVRNQWVKWSFFGNTSALTIVRWLGEDEWMKEHFQWNLFNDFKLESLTREYNCCGKWLFFYPIIKPSIYQSFIYQSTYLSIHLLFRLLGHVSCLAYRDTRED